jgi:imidazolonepropionase-like amidohydrolase
MRTLLTLTALFICTAATGQTPASQLAKPPANALHYLILSTAGHHGTSDRWVTSDGVHMARESMNLRGQAFELDSAAHFGPDGMLDRVTVRGFTPNGDAAETFAMADGQANWKSQVDAGSKAYAAPAMYASFGGPVDLNADLLDALLAAPGKSLALLPSGHAHAEKITSLTVGEGTAQKTVDCYAVSGLYTEPVPLWADQAGHFFGVAGSLAWLPTGYEAALQPMLKAQDDALAVRATGLAQSIPKTPAGAVAFTHVRAFLGGDHFADAQTVVFDHGLITEVGDAGRIAVPAGAEIIDGTGKTLVPGLWDAHMHFGDDASGVMLLSLGETSARDPGNINALTLARAARRAKGELLSPRVYPSMLIDGRGPYTAQMGSVAGSQDEAMAIVHKAKDDGFNAIKIYGTFNPAWVPATIAEAHRLGLHVHGHIPAGMRTMDAINDGYDEITHIYFVMMQALPDSVVKVSNGMARFEGPGRYAKDVDLSAEPMKSLIATMAARHIAVDPTLVVVEALYVPENGDLSPSYAPFSGTLPPALERGFLQGGFAVPKDLTRADYRASFAKMVALTGALHKAGVRIVAGTDGMGIELVHELELYVQAGMTPAEALAAATIEPARLVGADARTGSIAVGKAADLVLIDGDPSRSIGDLRQTRVVVMDGKVMDADALRAAGGFSGRPK